MAASARHWPRIDEHTTLVVATSRHTVAVARTADAVAVIDTAPPRIVFHDGRLRGAHRDEGGGENVDLRLSAPIGADADDGTRPKSTAQQRISRVGEDSTSYEADPLRR